MTEAVSGPRAWRCGRFEVALTRPLVMGIVNVTPDSFSDGGLCEDAERAIAHARELVLAGADIIDVGGESTRPGSDEVSPGEEARRVVPVIRALAEEIAAPLSIDTRHADVARQCVVAGASIINDVSGFRDPAMVELAAQCDAGLVVMHMLGEPKTMGSGPHYGDVVAEVRDYLASRAAALEAAGVARERIMLDPGIGFGKTTAHNLAILRRLGAIESVGYPVLVGASRKRFVGELTDVAEPCERVAGSIAVALWSSSAGAAAVRVHDVAETVRAFRMWAALSGEPHGAGVEGRRTMREGDGDDS